MPLLGLFFAAGARRGLGTAPLVGRPLVGLPRVGSGRVGLGRVGSVRVGLPSAGALLLLGSLLGGCGASDMDDPGLGGPGPSDEATSLAFVPGGVLKLLPLERAELGLAAGPPGHYTVRFALLPDRPNSDPNDASLDRAEILTDARGVGTVALTAPSMPSTFAVRASIGELEARLAVAVSDKGYGTVIAEPVYHGVRTVEQWVASVRIGSSCADLVGFPPPDGALVATSDAAHAPRIDSIPVGPIASVSVRSGQFAYGCTNLPDLGTDEVRKVHVDVVDRPMQLEGELALRLDFDDAQPAWTTLLDTAVQDALGGFRDDAPDDVTLLLDGMQELSTQPSAFEENRSVHDFDSVVAAVLPGQHLYQHAQSWLTGGLTPLGPLEGELEFRSSSALFRLVRAAGVPTADSGFLGSSTWSAFADPADTLVLGGLLGFQVTRWVVALADAPALTQFPGAADAAEALVLLADCQLIGANLAAAAGGEVSPGCDGACAERLCEAALVAAWSRAADANGGLTRLAVGVTGKALVDENARPLSLSGSWLGTLTGATSAVGGKAEGTPP